MKIIILISLSYFTNKIVRLLQNPAINSHQLFISNTICIRIIVVQITQLKTQRISQRTIRCDNMLDNIFRHRNIIPVIFGCYPETQNIGTVLVGISFGGLRTSITFGNLTTMFIDKEAVCQYRFIGSFILINQIRHQGRLEPSAVLIATFKVQICWFPTICLQNAYVAASGIDPNIQRILALFEVFITPCFRWYAISSL